MSRLLLQVLGLRKRLFDERRVNNEFDFFGFFFCYCLSLVLREESLSVDREKIINKFYNRFVFNNYCFEKARSIYEAKFFKVDNDKKLMTLLSPKLLDFENIILNELGSEEVSRVGGIVEPTGGHENLAVNIGHII